MLRRGHGGGPKEKSISDDATNERYFSLAAYFVEYELIFSKNILAIA